MHPTLAITTLILLSFLIIVCQYVIRRRKLALMISYNNSNNDDDDDEEDDDDGKDNNIDEENDIIERLVVQQGKNNQQNRSISDPEWCKSLILQIPSSKVNDKDICNELGGRLCSGFEMKRINIPESFKTDIFSSNGFKLHPGQSYCVYKQPPTNSNNCDDVWGFWIYSPVYERWLCKSKVPGIYNSKTNTFDACQRHDPNGRLLFDGQFVDDFKKLSLVPEDFYSEEFQTRFECHCPTSGYISRPELSRSVCFRDPCTLSLPIHAVAPGYDKITGNCDCGKHFVNMFNDESYPCTACPYSFPDYDADTSTLSIFIKCFNEDSDKLFGLFPCQSQEDKIRGCMKAQLKVKALKDSGKDNTTFEERIFF